MYHGFVSNLIEEWDLYFNFPADKHTFFKRILTQKVYLKNNVFFFF